MYINTVTHTYKQFDRNLTE